MSIPTLLPKLESPPDTYDKEYLASLLKALEAYFQSLNNKGQIIASQLSSPQMQVDGYGLRVGDLYQSNGFVKIVRSSDIFFSSPSGMAGSVGTVTTSP